MHPLYRYAYVTDREEGLVVVDVDMLADGDPQNNFLERVATFNPDGALDGARYLTVAGNSVYILLRPRAGRGEHRRSAHAARRRRARPPDLVDPRAIAVQFRYAFVTDAEGLKVLDVTGPDAPRLAATLPIAEAGDLYVARTYAYVAAGSQGLAIVDVERPTQPVLYAIYNADGVMNDTRSVRVGGTYGSVFAYVADGKNGLRVLQLIAPNENPDATGFSPPPTPRLIATYATDGPALDALEGHRPRPRRRRVRQPDRRLRPARLAAVQPPGDGRALPARRQVVHRRGRAARQGRRVRAPVRARRRLRRLLRPARPAPVSQAGAPVAGTTVMG